MVTEVRRRRLPVLGTASPLSFIHLDDAVSATVAALDRGAPGTAYNVADNEPASWTTFVTALAEAVGAPAPRRVPAGLIRLGAPYAAAVLRGGVSLSNEKAQRELAWRPSIPTYRDGIQRLVEEMQ
jgi:nucleoside-diphosphate-sugar epimerase